MIELGEQRSTGGPTLLAVLALVACCAGPLIVVAAGGALASAVGWAARFWPLVALGLVAAVWAGAKVVRAARMRARFLRDQGGRRP